MVGFFKKLFDMETTCATCKTNARLRRCPHCKKVVCYDCLKLLVSKENWPKWFHNKPVEDMEQLKGYIEKYASDMKSRGMKIHVCDQFIKFRWKFIEEAMDEADYNIRFKLKSM